VLYFENDFRDSSPALLSFVMRELGYVLYWHAAPIFDEDNFFGNRENHWAPKNICSLMMLGIPSERKMAIKDLRPVRDKDDWWDQG
jgi:hypothetical protein